MKEEWSYATLCPSCRIPSNTPTIQINHAVSVENQLTETLIRESGVDKIPLNFHKLIKSVLESTNDESTNESTNDMDETWIEFGRWLHFNEPITRKVVRQHIRNIHKKIKNAAKVRKLKDPEIPNEINETMSKSEKDQLIASAQVNNVKTFRYVVNPECIVDKHNKTLVHLDVLNDNNAVIEATKAVNNYYFHLIKEASHRSKSFWSNLTERFGAFRSYTTLPYTSSDTASSHNIAHQECVNNLLYELQPLSNSVNRFVKQCYEHYYTKLSKLVWGPFAPKSFGVFPTIAINFNIISNYHWDSNDDPNGLCFLVALGDFKGGELCFPQLQIVVKLIPGQVVAFPSRLLLHGNLPIIKGIRFSIVFFVIKVNMISL